MTNHARKMEDKRIQEELPLYFDLKFVCEGLNPWWPIEEVQIIKNARCERGELFCRLRLRPGQEVNERLIYGRYCSVFGRRKIYPEDTCLHPDEILFTGVCYGISKEGQIVITGVGVLARGHQALMDGSWHETPAERRGRKRRNQGAAKRPYDTREAYRVPAYARTLPLGRPLDFPEGYCKPKRKGKAP
jgi:hypothetical protein